MVNSELLAPVVLVVRLYVASAVACVGALAALSASGSEAATDHAWGHAVVVLVFAVVLPLRLRSAQGGSRGGLRAVGLISGVLVAVNAVEANLPDSFPTWMRIEMVAVAVLMAINVLLVVRVALAAPVAPAD